MQIAILIFTIIALIILIIILMKVSKKTEIHPDIYENSVRKAMESISLDEKIGRINKIAEQIADNYRSFEVLLKSSQKGKFGEIGLEEIIKDALPSNLYTLQKEIQDIGRPDATIITDAGRICIDSKFPLQKYEEYILCEESEKAGRKKEIFKAFSGHAETIRKYIKPSSGTAEFVLMYIPSEAVYYFLVTEFSEELIEFVKKGVQVVSPTTFYHKLTLIRSGLTAKKLSEEVKDVIKKLNVLKDTFGDFEKDWDILYKHIVNSYNSKDKVHTDFQKIKNAVENIEEISE